MVPDCLTDGQRDRHNHDHSLLLQADTFLPSATGVAHDSMPDLDRLPLSFLPQLRLLLLCWNLRALTYQ